MKGTILVIVLVYIIAINAAPVKQTCAKLLASVTSTGVYAYCNKTTNTLAQGNSLNNLYDVSDEFMDTLTMLCETHNERVSIEYYTNL